MITRKEILNPYNNEYNTHIHKYNKFEYVTYRCKHTVYEMIPYCHRESYTNRLKRLCTLLCESCEDEQMQWLKEEYDM